MPRHKSIPDEVFLKFWKHAENNQEIADHFGVSLDAVKSRVKRLKKIHNLPDRRFKKNGQA